MEWWSKFSRIRVVMFLCFITKTHLVVVFRWRTESTVWCLLIAAALLSIASSLKDMEISSQPSVPSLLPPVFFLQPSNISSGFFPPHSSPSTRFGILNRETLRRRFFLFQLADSSQPCRGMWGARPQSQWTIAAIQLGLIWPLLKNR